MVLALVFSLWVQVTRCGRRLMVLLERRSKSLWRLRTFQAWSRIARRNRLQDFVAKLREEACGLHKEAEIKIEQLLKQYYNLKEKHSVMTFRHCLGLQGPVVLGNIFCEWTKVFAKAKDKLKLQAQRMENCVIALVLNQKFVTRYFFRLWIQIFIQWQRFRNIEGSLQRSMQCIASARVDSDLRLILQTWFEESVQWKHLRESDGKHTTRQMQLWEQLAGIRMRSAQKCKGHVEQTVNVLQQSASTLMMCFVFRAWSNGCQRYVMETHLESCRTSWSSNQTQANHHFT